VFRQTELENTSGKGTTVKNSIFYTDTGSYSKNSTVGQLSDSSWFYHNYVLNECDNPHSFSAWLSASGTNVFHLWKNVIQQGLQRQAFTDGGDMVIPTNNFINAHHNIVLDAQWQWLINLSNGTRSGKYWRTNNTMLMNINSSGALANNENGAITLSGADTAKYNLIFDTDSAGSVSRGIAFGTAGDNQISYTDTNNWIGVNDRYYGTVITGKTEGSTGGFGLGDVAIRPMFTDTSRKIGSWNKKFGTGTGNDSGAILYLLGINGYDPATRQQSATPSANMNLWSWVTDGYHPTAHALRGLSPDTLTGTLGADSVVDIIWLRSKIDSGATTYTDSFELSGLIDSATVYLQDSTAGGTWGTRTTSSKYPAGTKTRIQRTDGSAGKYWLRLIALTNQGAADTTARDSTTLAVNTASSGGNGGMVGGAVGALGLGLGIWALMRRKKIPTN
jgi:hypothetical protein